MFLLQYRFDFLTNIRSEFKVYMIKLPVLKNTNHKNGASSQRISPPPTNIKLNITSDKMIIIPDIHIKEFVQYYIIKNIII